MKITTYTLEGPVNGVTHTLLDDTEIGKKLSKDTGLTLKEIQSFWKNVDKNSEERSLDVGVHQDPATEIS